ncbi:MAG: hypothetical protein L0226_16085 [Acidobacteria bacterium]|nr:hypothetical protein [Acidobacteriota bacterium]
MQEKCTFKLSLFLAAALVALFTTSEAQTVAKKKAEITTTERQEFGSRGTIYIVDSFGEIRVEGWDQQEVEVTVKRTTQKEYEPKNIAKAVKDLQRVKIEMELVSESTMLIIKTTFPPRTPTRMLRGKSNANLEYTIKVPRHSKLVINHDIGEVTVANVDGDMEVTNRIGEISLKLPQENQYTIDAKAKIGDVSSEFGEPTSRQKLLGAKLESDPPPTARRLFLRVGIGEIQVSKM